MQNNRLKKKYICPLAEVLGMDGVCLLDGSWAASRGSNDFNAKRVFTDNGGDGDVEEYGSVVNLDD